LKSISLSAGAFLFNICNFSNFYKYPLVLPSQKTFIMKKSFYTSFALLFILILNSCNSTSQVNAGYKNISQAEFQKTRKETNAIILDVRTPSEISQGFIEGATVFIDVNNVDFESKIDQLDKSKNYIVYCRSGARSAKAATIMAQKGFKNIYNLEGGITNYSGKIKN